jgi:hypothetical protein
MLALTGCNNPFNDRVADLYQVNRITTVTGTQSYIVEGKIDVNHPDFLALYGGATTDPAKRNQIINVFRRMSDEACGEHLARISANAASYNFLLGTITNLTAGLATFVGGGSTTQGLAAGAAFSSGTRSLVNEQFYSQQIGPIITRAIRENRDQQGNAIVEKMKTDQNAYPVDQALFELGRYHESCSFYVGVELLNRAVATQRRTKAELDAEINALTTRINGLTAEIRDMAQPNTPAEVKELIPKRKEMLDALEEKRKSLIDQRSEAAQ